MNKELFIEDIETSVAIDSRPNYYEKIANNIKELEQKIEQDEEVKKSAAFYFLQYGIFAENYHAFDHALYCYQKSLEYCSDTNSGHFYWQVNNLGFCLNYLERFAEAEPFLRLAIKADPLRHNAWKNLGVSLEYQGKFTQAWDSYKRSSELCPSDDRASRHLERMLERFGSDFETTLGRSDQ